MPSDYDRDYDDWGYPKRPRAPPPGGSHRDSLWSLTIVPFLRRYRTVCALAATTLLLLAWLSSGGDSSRPSAVRNVDWKRVAYVQVVSDTHQLCHAYMVFEALKRFGSRAERVLLYPNDWDLVDSSPQDRDSQLLLSMRRHLKTVLQPIQLLSGDGDPVPGSINHPTVLDTGLTKLRVFELEEYDRVLYLDSDITLLQHLDELFLLPRTPIAMPRAYWVHPDLPPDLSEQPATNRQLQPPLTSLLMLLEPSRLEFENLIDTFNVWRHDPTFQWTMKYENELLNHRFASSALVLPHRPYAMLSAEFRATDHRPYLGTVDGPRHPSTEWNADRAFLEAKVIHFHDYPLPKPWTMWPLDGLAEMQPACAGDGEGEAAASTASDATCPERKIWKGLYDDFRKRRRDLCRILSIPAPKWSDIRNASQVE